jgi:anti-anti-sigma factor
MTPRTYGVGAPRGGLAVDVVGGDGTVRLVLAGELDLNTAAWLGERIRRVEADRPETLVLDLRGLGFMDSSGLRELFAAQRRAHREGRRLILVKGSRPIDRVLELVRAEAAVEIVDDPAAIDPEPPR